MLQKIKKHINLSASLVVLLLAVSGFQAVGVEAAAKDPILVACQKAVKDNIEKKACSAANIKKTKEAANTVCMLEMKGAAGPPSPACLTAKSNAYIKDAATSPVPKTDKDFTLTLGKILDNAKKTTEATTPPSSTPTKKSTGCSVRNSCDLIEKYLNPSINLLAGLLGLFAVISLVMGGIQYSMATGDPQKIAKARGRIAATVIALVSFFFLYAFLQFLVPGGIFNK